MIAESESPLPQHLETPPAAAMLGTLDLTNGNDRASLLRRLKEKRWGEITPEFKVDAVKALKVALRWALEKNDQRAVNSIVRTLGFLEGQNQKDDHKLVDTGDGPGVVRNTNTQVNVGVNVEGSSGLTTEAGGLRWGCRPTRSATGRRRGCRTSSTRGA